MRRIAGLAFATLLTTGAASASSFVTPEPMTTKLGPSMVMLGEPAIKPAAQPTTMDDQAKPAEMPGKTIAAVIDEAPLDYPFPGGKRGVGAQPAGAADFVHVSASIIAMAEPEPAVSLEHVAAVDKDADDSEAERQRELFGPLPTVIRGGVVDNGGPTEVSAPSATVEKPATRNSSPAAGGRAASSSRQPPKQPDAPIPSPTPPPPPANIVPQTKIQ